MSENMPFPINKLLTTDPKLVSDQRIREILKSGKTVGENPNPDRYSECKLVPVEMKDSNIHKMLKNIQTFEFDQDDPETKSNPIMGPFLVNDEMKIYIGQFQDDRMSGRGIAIYQNRCYYEGYFENNATHKFGRLIYEDGDMYLGELKRNTMEGKGVYYKKDGSMYTGTFHNDAPEGKGREKWEDGAEFKGEYKEGSKDGYGEFKFNNQDVYKGFFKEDVFHGEGILVRKNGVQFKGNWSNGDLDSPATIIMQSGSEYVGEIKKMASNGRGKLTDGGRVYIGNFLNGKPEGEVEVVYLNEDKVRKANFKDGKFYKWQESSPQPLRGDLKKEASDGKSKDSKRKKCLFC